MLQSPTHRNLVLAALVISIAACSDGGGTTEPQAGSVQVTVTTTGRVMDRDGYALSLQGQSATTTVAVNGPPTTLQAPEGTHTLSLTGIAENCQVGGGPAATITVSGGKTSQASFAVVCAPDRVAYISQEVDGRFGLFVERLDGSGRQRVAFPVQNQRFSWSPDGYRIAYTAAVAGSVGAQVWMVDIETGTQTQLTTDGYLNTEATWSPDGTSMVYRSQAQGAANCDLWMMTIGGSKRALTTTTSTGLCLSFPDWSPDGSRIYYLTRSFAGLTQQWMDATGANHATITDWWPRGPVGVSPDGSQLAFATGFVAGGDVVYDLRTALSNGTDVRTVARMPGLPESGVTWVSATRLGFANRISTGGLESVSEVWTVNADGTALTRTAIGAGLRPLWVRWQ